MFRVLCVVAFCLFPPTLAESLGEAFMSDAGVHHSLKFPLLLPQDKLGYYGTLV